MKHFLIILMLTFLMLLFFCDDENKSVNNPPILQYAEIHGFATSELSISPTRIPNTIVTIAGRTDTTNYVGRFFLDSIPYGENYYTCIHPDYYVKDGLININKSLQIVEFFLNRDPNIISGQVKTGKDEIIEDAVISFGDISDTTDSEGNYSLSVYDYGALLISCTHPDYTDCFKAVNVSDDTTSYNIIWSGSYVDTLWIEEDVTVISRRHTSSDHMTGTISQAYLEDSNFSYLDENGVKCWYQVNFCWPGDTADYWLSRTRTIMYPPLLPYILPNHIDSAICLMKNKFSIDGEFHVKYALSSWDENEVTWLNQPEISSTISFVPLFHLAEITKMNLTHYYTDTTYVKYGIVLTGENDCSFDCMSYLDDGWGWVNFHSSEAENPEDRPYVVIYYTID